MRRRSRTWPACGSSSASPLSHFLHLPPLEAAADSSPPPLAAGAVGLSRWRARRRSAYSGVATAPSLSVVTSSLALFSDPLLSAAPDKPRTVLVVGVRPRRSLLPRSLLLAALSSSLSLALSSALRVAPRARQASARSALPLAPHARASPTLFSLTMPLAWQMGAKTWCVSSSLVSSRAAGGC
mgnify:CR=1 FL=1